MRLRPPNPSLLNLNLNLFFLALDRTRTMHRARFGGNGIEDLQFHPVPGERSPIPDLSARFRIERGLVQNQLHAVAMCSHLSDMNGGFQCSIPDEFGVLAC